MLTTLVYSLLALDQTVAQIAAQNGHWLYLILFLVIFAETGLVVMPFLPGDSILFIAGRSWRRRTERPPARRRADCRGGARRHDQLLGRSLHRTARLRQADLALVQAGAPAPHAGVLRHATAASRSSSAVHPDHPDVRAVPCGVAGMTYREFLSYNVVGAVLWISSLVYAGYLFGNIPWVKQNLTLIVFLIVVVSLIPR
jgi:membrane-associated protein